MSSDVEKNDLNCQHCFDRIERKLVSILGHESVLEKVNSLTTLAFVASETKWLVNGWQTTVVGLNTKNKEICSITFKIAEVNWNIASHLEIRGSPFLFLSDETLNVLSQCLNEAFIRLTRRQESLEMTFFEFTVRVLDAIFCYFDKAPVKQKQKKKTTNKSEILKDPMLEEKEIGAVVVNNVKSETDCIKHSSAIINRVFKGELKTDAILWYPFFGMQIVFLRELHLNRLIPLKEFVSSKANTKMSSTEQIRKLCISALCIVQKFLLHQTDHATFSPDDVFFSSDLKLFNFRIRRPDGSNLPHLDRCKLHMGSKVKVKLCVSGEFRMSAPSARKEDDLRALKDIAAVFLTDDTSEDAKSFLEELKPTAQVRKLLQSKFLVDELTNANGTELRTLCILGEGSFGKCFLARHKSDCIDYAIKQIDLEDDDEADYFKKCREIQFLCQLRHKNLIKYSHSWTSTPVGATNEVLHIQMEYGGHLTLDDLISRNELKRNNGYIFYLVNGICAGLNYMHGMKLFHCDLKPNNVFVNDLKVKIGDFGLSRFSGEKMSSKNPFYQPPEVRFACSSAAVASNKIDSYSLGIIIFEMFYGPFPNDNEFVRAIQSLTDFNRKFPPDFEEHFPDHWGQSQLVHCSLVTYLIKKLINATPDLRLSIFELLRDPIYCALRIDAFTSLPYFLRNKPAGDEERNKMHEADQTTCKP